jgi:peroxiredoxin
MGTRHSRTAAEGTVAPEIALGTVDGGTWKLSEARAGGPVILVFLRGFF